MLADELDYVVGVDTHRDEHVVAVVAAPAGAVVAAAAAAANVRGYRERFASLSGTRPVAASGRSREQVAMAPGWPASSANAARSCSRPAALQEQSGGLPARTTPSTPSARHGRHLRQTRSPSHAQVNAGKRCGSSWWRGAAPSMCAAKH